MASAPRLGSRSDEDLDYEAEEAAILGATRGEVDLLVEESGDPDELIRRLNTVREPLPVIHLSCHGDNGSAGAEGRGEPALILENEEGSPRRTTARQLKEILRPQLPSVLFVSACLTSTPDVEGGSSFASTLVQRGMPAVVAWDGLISDLAANAFARSFYRRLALRMPVAAAAAAARREMLLVTDEDAKARAGLAALGEHLASPAAIRRRQWHLARIWIGGRGGGSVVGGTARPRPGMTPLPFNATIRRRTLNGADVILPGPDIFVGRRRELQTAVKVLRGREESGLVLYGPGSFGKSSLAERITSRLDNGFAVARASGGLRAGSILSALAQAIVGQPEAGRLLNSYREALDRAGDNARKQEEALNGALTALLLDEDSPLHARDLYILIVLDGLEDVLDKSGSQDGATDCLPVLEPARPILRALCAACTPQGRGRLLITSRFRFSLPGADGDTAQALHMEQVPPFSERARQKLALRHQAAIGALQAWNQPACFTGGMRGPHDTAPAPDAGPLSATSPDRQPQAEPLLKRIQELSGGNPGLQDLLGQRLAGSSPRCRAEVSAALDQLQAYLCAGTPPHDGPLRAFLDGLGLPQLLHAATDTGRALLGAMRAFRLPMPERVLEPLQKDVGRAVARLRSLGLLDLHEDLVIPGEPALSINPLVAPLLRPPQSDGDQAFVASLVLPVLFQYWRASGDRPPAPSSVDCELTRLALLADDREVIAACAAEAVQSYMEQHKYRAAGELGDKAIAALIRSNPDRLVPLPLVSATGDAWTTIGEGECADAAFEKGLPWLDKPAIQPDLKDLGDFLFRLGNREAKRKDKADVRLIYHRLCEIEKQRGDNHRWAIARCREADLLDNPEEKQAVWENEVLPVFRGCDEYWTVLVEGRLARALMGKFDYDEALRLSKNAQQVLRRLGDRYEEAVAWRRIGDIHAVRNHPDEALKTYSERVLPVFKELDRPEANALTLNRVADILADRGQYKEALEIREKQVLPLFHRSKDRHEIANTVCWIADIYLKLREREKALRLWREEALPLVQDFDRVWTGRIYNRVADVLAQLGRHDEALRTRRDDALPNFAGLDALEAARTQCWIGDSYRALGQWDEALKIWGSALDVFRRKNDRQWIAFTQTRLGDALQFRGALAQAVKTWRDVEQYCQDIGDSREKVITAGKIAGVWQIQRELDAALALRKDVQLPFFEYEPFETARIRRCIVEIQLARNTPGSLGEALRILTEDVLPVFVMPKDQCDIAITWGLVADVWLARGALEKAWHIREEDKIPLLSGPDDQLLLAIARGRMADIKLRQGQPDEARRLQEDSLTTCRALGGAYDMANALLCLGRIDLAQAQYVDAKTHLREAWELFGQMGCLPGCTAAGPLLAEALTACGDAPAIPDLLQKTIAACEHLGQAEDAHRLAAMIGRLAAD